MYPLKIISKKKSGLVINWSNGSRSEIQSKILRKNCPCATCLAERERYSLNYIPIYSDNEITIEKISVIGNYAIGISWNDGHNTGIYEFPYLFKLASPKETELKT